MTWHRAFCLSMIVVVMFTCFITDMIVIVQMNIEKIRVRRHHRRSGEATDAEDLTEIYLRMTRTQYLRSGIQAAHACAECIDGPGIDQIGFIDNDAIRRNDLIQRLVIAALQLGIIEMLIDMHLSLIHI